MLRTPGSAVQSRSHQAQDGPIRVPVIALPETAPGNHERVVHVYQGVPIRILGHFRPDLPAQLQPRIVQGEGELAVVQVLEIGRAASVPEPNRRRRKVIMTP